MNEKTAKIIVSLIGVAGLILYGYLIFMSDISADYQKYTVLAAGDDLDTLILCVVEVPV